MLTTNEIIESVRQSKQHLANEFKLKTVGIFGSVIRGEQTENSDVDLLVELDGDGDILDLIGIGQYMEERLQTTVDVVPKDALRQEIKAQILKEVRYL